MVSAAEPDHPKATEPPDPTIEAAFEDPAPPVALLTQIQNSQAARDVALVLAAQGLAAAISLGIDVLLFRTMTLAERGTLSAALGFRNVLLYLADIPSSAAAAPQTRARRAGWASGKTASGPESAQASAVTSAARAMRMASARRKTMRWRLALFFSGSDWDAGLLK